MGPEGIRVKHFNHRNYAHVCRAFDGGQDQPFAHAACPTPARVVASNVKLPATMPLLAVRKPAQSQLTTCKNACACPRGETPVKLELSTRPYELVSKLAGPCLVALATPDARAPRRQHDDAFYCERCPRRKACHQRRRRENPRRGLDQKADLPHPANTRDLASIKHGVVKAVPRDSDQQFRGQSRARNTSQGAPLSKLLGGNLRQENFELDTALNTGFGDDGSALRDRVPVVVRFADRLRLTASDQIHCGNEFLAVARGPPP
jgi:hypothetical protein